MAAAMPAPIDVRLMNITATVLFILGGAGVLVAAGGWALRHPLFSLGGITVRGDVVHNNAVTLRANVAPRATSSR
jgi:cell division protein FtsQ